MTSFILALVFAAVLTVLAHFRRHSPPLWIATVLAWGITIRYAAEQLSALAHMGWASLFGA